MSARLLTNPSRQSSLPRFARNLRLRLSCAVIAMLGCSAPALADGDHYIGGGMGAFQLSNGINKDTVFGAFMLLGHQFSEHFSAEIRLGGTGSSGDGDALAPRPKQRMDFVAHYIKPHWNFNRNISAYGLLGFAVVHGSYQAVGGAKQSKNRISYAYGAGINYRWSADFSVDAEFTHMLSKPKNDPATINTSYKGLEANSFTAALKYYF